MSIKQLSSRFLFYAWAFMLPFSVNAEPTKPPKISVEKKQVIAHWTADRRQQAIPRDLLLDAKGNAFLKGNNGKHTPYGLTKADIELNRKSGSDSKDSTDPVILINSMFPADGDIIGASSTFRADITDDSGVRSANVIISYPSPSTQTQSIAATRVGNTWSVTLEGFTDGDWSWRMQAKDASSGKGNTTTSGFLNFSVETNVETVIPDPGESGEIVTNARWTKDDSIQHAAGRIYFEMPNNRRMHRWSGYVCSGTVVSDDKVGRSIIITAAHCVYDDVNKAVARNVLFIPNQALTTGSGTDSDCDNDPIGCWVTSLGIVDDDWSTRTFPDNIPWDYAFYVVEDSGSHRGLDIELQALDDAVDELELFFGQVHPGAEIPFTHALGYSYSDDPYFMYCAEDLSDELSDNWWLAHCELSGGASGGPWIQPMTVETDKGPIISVNSWGYTTEPGMAGPLLFGTSAECIFDRAKSTEIPTSSSDGDAGVTVGC